MKELIESIEEYIKRPYTDYAVMINGEWGSGKTHFWNNKLRQRIENITNKNGKKYKTIYISLYGINSLEEISKKIFLETNPMVNKGLKKYVENSNPEGNIIPEYVKTGIDIANLYGTIELTQNSSDFEKLFATDDKVLCFDDLERANIDIIDILGYINNFVEHDEIKTILICNEKELATKFKNNNIELKTLTATMMLGKEGKLEEKEGGEPLANVIDEKVKSIFDRVNAYERIKEKLIGECFEYMPEYTYILNGMIMRYEYNPDLSKFLKKEISTIIYVFNKTNTKNLRVLKHSLNDFEKIYSVVKENFPETSDETLKTLLMFTIAVSFEIKIGTAAKNKFSTIESNEEYKSIIFTSSIMNDANQYYIKEFDTRYFLNNKSEYRFFKFVEIYVRTRMFNERIFKENMEEANTKKDKKQNPNYVKLLNGSYWKMSDFDFSVLFDQVLFSVKDGEIPTKEFVRLFSVCKYLCEIGVSRYDIKDIKDKFLYGYKMALINESKLKIDMENIEISEIKDDITKEFAEECGKLKLSIYDDIMREKVSYLFKNLIDNIEEFYVGITGEYKELPIFEKYNMGALYDKLLIISNYDLYNIISLIPARYENNQLLLKMDSANLKKLIQVIEERNIESDMSIKKALLNNLKDTVDQILSSK